MKIRLQLNKNKEIEYGGKYGFSGFEFIANNYQYLSNKKFALITAYKVTLFDKVKDAIDRETLESITVIDKGTDDFIMDMLSFLNS